MYGTNYKIKTVEENDLNPNNRISSYDSIFSHGNKQAGQGPSVPDKGAGALRT